MSKFTASSRDPQPPAPIEYTCRLCGDATSFQPSNYQPTPGVAVGIAGMVYYAKREAHCRGICFACLNGRRRQIQERITELESRDF